MANYQSRYTGPEIDERLRKAGEAVLTEAQSLDAGEQAQARENIGAASSAAVDGKYTKPSGGIPASDLASGVQASLGKADTAYQKPASGIPADDIAPGVIPDVSQFITDDDLSAALAAKQDTIADLADIRSGSQNNVKYTQQTLSDAQKAQARSNIGAGTYDKPDGGIPESDLAQAVKDKLNATEIYPVTYGTTTQTQIAAAVAAGKLPVCKYGDNVYVYAGESSAGYSQFTSVLYNTAARIYVKDSTWGNGNFDIYSKPSGGIPKSDLASGVQASLGKADTALQEHQDISGKADKVSGATSGDFAGLDSNGNLTDSGSKASDFATAAQGAKADSAYQKPQDGIPASDLEAGVIPTVPVRDVTLDDISVLDGTTAKLPAYPKSPRIFMGTCSTAAATVAKEATVETFPLDANNKPLVGTVVGIKFTNTNSATAPTLNVNSTGAASIWYNNAAYEGKGAYGGSASRYIYYVWDGTYWAFQGWSYDADADTNTIGYNLRTNGGTAVAAAKFYRYRLLFTAPDGQSLVPSNTSSSTSTTAAKTVNQAKIDPFAPIWYYSTTTAINAGSSASASYLWMQYSAIPLGYAFNRTGAALTMTARYPVYLKCAPQSDGSAIMDADTPIVQALPSTEDGKIYIFLGYAESEVNITLYYWHPVYYFKDGAIRLWTNAAATSNGVQDVTVGGTSVVSEGVAEIPAIPEEIDTVAVTVDNNTGMPSASGSVSGGTLSLSFQNLKGAKGDKGDQGNPGSSQDYPFTLANNLTTDDSTVALTAAQGVVLGNKWKLPDTQIPVTTTGAHSTNGNYTDSVLAKAGAKCLNMPVTPGQKYKIYGTSDSSTWYRCCAVFKADGTKILTAPAGDYTVNPYEVTIPSDGAKMTVNLINYAEATDGLFLVGDSYDASIFQGEIETIDKAANGSIDQANFSAGVRMKSDRYSSILADWMQYSADGAVQDNTAVMAVVSSTADSITLSAADAAHFLVWGPAVVHFPDGSVKMAYFDAPSGSTLSLKSPGQVDLTGADYVQNLHDTARGGAGIHLSQLGYIGLAQFTALEIASKLSQKDSNLLRSVQFYNGSIDGKSVKDVNGNVVATFETTFATGAFTPNGNGLTAMYGIVTGDSVNINYSGFLNNSFRFQQGEKDRYLIFKVPAVGKGFLEIETCGWSPRKPATSTGTCTMSVYVDGTLVYSTTLVPFFKRYQIPDINARGEVEVKFNIDGNVDTECAVYSINLWAMSDMVPAVNLSGKKIAVLGDSWTQFPGVANALEMYASYNTVGTRPDGTTLDGLAYFPKELARVTGATVDNWGKSNMRADNWGLPMIDTILATKQYDYLLIEFFTNDVNASISAADWAANIALIAEKCKRACVRPLIMLPCRSNGPTINPLGIYHEVSMRGLGLM